MKSLGFFLALVALVPPALAQCPVPDGLNGPCCAPTFTNLPTFPAFSMPGVAICYQQCLPNAVPCIKWDFQPPQFVACGQYALKVDVYECNGGTHQLGGAITLDYTRTWDEASPNGLLQVWRFAAKVDFAHNTAILPDPCIVPTSLSAFPADFYYGYVDYALNCANGTWEMAVVLAHACDWFVHGNPVFSSRPGAHHPGRSYALVGPDTAANPFVPALMPAPFGPLIGEGTRTSANVPGVACSTEEPLQGAVTPLIQACLCAPALIPPQVTARRLSTFGACGTSVSTIDTLSLGLPWLDLMTTAIGTWTTPASYPGPERAWVDEGPVIYVEGCPDPTGVQNVYAELMYGGTTANGYPILPTPLSPPPSALTDLAGNWSWKLGTPLPLPMYGNVMPTTHVVYVSHP